MSNEKRFVVKHGLQSQNIEFISPDRSKNMSLAISNNGSISFSGIGNVGVGTTTPVSRLQIIGGSINTGGGTGLGISSDLASGRFVAGPSVAAIASSQDASTVEISAGSTGGQSGVAVSGSGGDQPSTVRFFSNNAERMRITSAGNVGIGTTAPSTKLDVNGAITFATNGSGTNYLRYERTATNIWSFTSDGVGEIYRVSGNVVQFKQNVLVEREGLTVQPTTGILPAITVNQTWNDVNTTFTNIKSNVTDTASAASSLLMDLQVGGVSRAKISKIGELSLTSNYNGNVVTLTATDRSVQFGTNMAADGFGIRGSLELTKDNGVIRFYNNNGTVLYGIFGADGGAANTLAQRNGIIAQTSRIYNTYTDASNYERAKIGWNGGILEIGTENAGTGTLRNISLIGGNVGIGTGAPAGKFHVTNTYTNTSDASIIAGGTIPGINLRSSGGARMSVFTNYATADSTSFLTSTGSANPSTEVLRFNHINGNVLVPTTNLGIGTISPSAKLDVAGDIEVNSNVNLNSEATTLATVTKTQIASFPIASFRSGKLIVQAYDSVTGEVQISELLVAHNGTTASATEYGVVFTGTTSIVIYDVDISAGNVRLMATRTTANSTQYKTSETLMVA